VDSKGAEDSSAAVIATNPPLPLSALISDKELI
jgi:hypothetical protein